MCSNATEADGQNSPNSPSDCCPASRRSPMPIRLRSAFGPILSGGRFPAGGGRPDQHPEFKVQSAFCAGSIPTVRGHIDVSRLHRGDAAIFQYEHKATYPRRESQNYRSDSPHLRTPGQSDSFPRLDERSTSGEPDWLRQGVITIDAGRRAVTPRANPGAPTVLLSFVLSSRLKRGLAELGLGLHMAPMKRSTVLKPSILSRLCFY